MLAGLALLCVLTAHAGDGDRFFNVSGGFLFNSTLNATLGYERELSYTNAVEVFGEVGNRWRRDPLCGSTCQYMHEEYYYWHGSLFFAYIWKDDQEELYYYRDGMLIRWIDKDGGIHDEEYDNEEYEERGDRYWTKAIIQAEM